MRSIRRSCLLATVLLFALAAPRRADTPPAGPQTPAAGVSHRGADTESLDRLRTAIERAARYLGTRELRGYGAWFTTQGAALLGPKYKTWARTLKIDPKLLELVRSGSPKSFPEALEMGIWSRRWLAERPAAQLSKPAITPVDRAESRGFEEPEAAAILGVLLASVACHNLSPAQRDGWLAFVSLLPGRGYLLTNQLFGLMLAYNQGCWTPRAGSPLRLRLATQVFAEFLGDRDALDQLAIERLAVLCYARACNWIDPELIARIVNEQRPWGSWGARDPRLYRGYRQTEEQTASLAFYVLARSWALRHASARRAEAAPHQAPAARGAEAAPRRPPAARGAEAAPHRPPAARGAEAAPHRPPAARALSAVPAYVRIQSGGRGVKHVTAGHVRGA